MPDLDDQHLDDSRLEQIMRDGLATRAALVQPTAPAEHPAYGHAHRGRNLWLGAAAAVLLVVAAIPVGQHLLADPPLTPGVTSRSPAPVPTGWRVESYAGVQLAVPATWGWGGTPVDPGTGDGLCQVRGATVTADGRRDLNASAPEPYVGRPILQSDACAVTPTPELRPDGDATWLGSPLPVGTRTFADGLVGRTVGVGRQRVSVFTHDPTLGRRILATVMAADDRDANGCSPAADDPAQAVGRSRPTHATGLVVCAYGRIGGSPDAVLIWSARRSVGAVEQYLSATGSHREPEATPCPVPTQGEVVELGVVDANGTAWDRVDLGSCSRIGLSGGTTAALVPDTTRPWSGPESMAYLVGPVPPAADPSHALAELFRGVLG